MYLVIINQPGYLPDDDPAEYDTMEDAKAAAFDAVMELSEAGYSVAASFPTTPSGYRVLLGHPDPGKLDWVIEIMEVR